MLKCSVVRPSHNQFGIHGVIDFTSRISDLDLRSLTSDFSASGSIDREHLEADNVLGPIHKAFGDKLWPLMEELNLTLAA